MATSLSMSRAGNLQKAITQKAIAKQNSKTARRGWQHAIFKPRAAKNTARGDQLANRLEHRGAWLRRRLEPHAPEQSVARVRGEEEHPPPGLCRVGEGHGLRGLGEEGLGGDGFEQQFLGVRVEAQERDLAEMDRPARDPVARPEDCALVGRSEDRTEVGREDLQSAEGEG
jgi:hypothetical protein